jgi:hypothetical protein
MELEGRLTAYEAASHRVRPIIISELGARLHNMDTYKTHVWPKKERGK